MKTNKIAIITGGSRGLGMLSGLLLDRPIQLGHRLLTLVEPLQQPLPPSRRP